MGGGNAVIINTICSVKFDKIEFDNKSRDPSDALISINVKTPRFAGFFLNNFELIKV